MLEGMQQQILELENSNKRSKSVQLPLRCPLPVYKLLYYYMKENDLTNKTEAVCDLIQYGFSYYAELGE